MHARIDQLLSLRDGAPIDANVRRHVEQCAVCLAQTARLSSVRDRLRSLPAIEPPRDRWAEIESRASQPPRRRIGPAVAAAVGVVAIAVIGFVGLREESAQTSLETAPLVAAIEPTDTDDLDALIEQTRELEAVLAYLPQPRVERVSTAATVDSIEQRIQWLDWQLANAAAAGLDRQQARRLWIERVDLMDSLVKVRYAQSAPLMF